MREAEVDALNILLKATEAAEAAMAKDMRQGDINTREGELDGDIVITYSVAEVPKENSKSLQKI